MNKIITQFIQKQTCATVCCVDEQGKPYCFNCFYVFNSEEGLLYFKSSPQSHHSALMKKKSFISGTILPDKLHALLVKGVQFEAIALNEDHPLSKPASAYYHKKHPLALAMPGETWTLQISRIKMTDRTLGFGKKITWNRDE
ncbi:MAG: pyridoxamine 5'-phosphate oxidase family protein [Sphingobacteriales bacterium]|nr:pyridoxamine 5'-phosphate oxidase family protein [Sphingobacteriales bacterium]